jgi:hypothetical protein
MEIGALADGFLDESEAAPIRAHMESCPECTSLYRDLRRIHDALSGDFDTPPDTLVPGVMYKVSLHKKGRRHLPFGWFTAAAAALAVVLLSGPLQEWFGFQRSQDAAPEAALFDAGIPPAAAPEARLFLGETTGLGPAMLDLADEPWTFYAEGAALVLEADALHAPEWWFGAAYLHHMAADGVTLLYVDAAVMARVYEELTRHGIPFVWHPGESAEGAGNPDDAGEAYGLIVLHP